MRSMICRYLSKAFILFGVMLLQLNVNGQVVDLGTLPQGLADGKDAPKFAPLAEYRGKRVYTINDPHFGQVPFRLHIPANYDPGKPAPLILLLHGAVGASHFSDAYDPGVSNEATSDPFYDKLCAAGYIVVMPYGDNSKGFSWVANKFGEKKNYTFTSLIAMIRAIKRVLNIDDDRVFAFGHSDGSDGAFALDVYQPDMFAGFVAYNSMLTNLFADNIYLHNAVNRPLYLVHSDLDDLRPIEQTRVIVNYLDSIKAPVKYKEYSGYKHYDRHLALDFPNALDFLKNTKRNPYPNTVYWETNDHLNDRCDWLALDDWDLKLPNAAWNKPDAILCYNKMGKSWLNRRYYDLSPSAAVQGSYHENVFTIKTSRVTKLEVLISAQMVDLAKNVVIVLNGKTVFDAKVSRDDGFVAEEFKEGDDKKALWVKSVPVDVADLR